MKLHAGISRKYWKRFLLNEDGLRRIHGVLEEYRIETSLGPPKYTVVREDQRFYETDSVEEVIADPNIISQRIVKLTIEVIDENAAYAHDEWVCRLVYSKDRADDEPPITLNIRSTNRQSSLLLADKLEPQILRATSKLWMASLIRIVPIMALLIFLLPMVGAQFTDFDSPFRNMVDSWMKWTMVLGIVIVFLFLVGDRIRAFIAPESVFLWGDELTANESRERTRRNWFWGILVGFLVSLAAGLAASIIGTFGTKPTNTATKDSHTEAATTEQELTNLKLKYDELKHRITQTNDDGIGNSGTNSASSSTPKL